MKYYTIRKIAEQEKLVEDLVKIVAVLSCELQSKKANKMVEELTEND